jgi:DNA integrity scanning protein DisA with diadenylate cyclase activity
MKPQKYNVPFAALCDIAVRLADAASADAILVMVDGPADWGELKQRVGDFPLLLAADTAEEVLGAADHKLPFILLDMPDAPIYERLGQALLEFVADDLLWAGADVVVVYSGFEAGKFDSLSLVKLDEHLGRLTPRDLQKIETQVPLDTLKLVVDLAVEIGREGREGKPVGCMFVVGDSQKVLAQSHPAGFDPVRGYSSKERDLHDPRVREAVKEVAQLDGAFVVSEDGIVKASCRLIDTAPVNLTLSKGLGARHWAGAAISKNTKAISVVVSESSGSVRIFHDGEIVLRIEPFRRALKWKDFDYEPPVSSE